jgi:hypothetical protein
MTLVRAMRPSLSHRRGGSSPTARLGARHGALGLGWPGGAPHHPRRDFTVTVDTSGTALLASVGMWRGCRKLGAGGASSVNISQVLPV